MSFKWTPFHSRRQFFRTLGGMMMKSASAAALMAAGVRPAAALFDKQVLPPGTDPGRLYNEDPQYLDTRNLEISPLHKFDYMGDNQVVVDLATWRLEVAGKGRTPLELTYPQLLKLPSSRKKALLICAGLFSYHAEYTGVSLPLLLDICQSSGGATRVVFHGQGEFLVGKKERFGLEKSTRNKLLLAYAVNGQPLPRQHGFPLRLVAQDSYGERWVKYVHKVEIL